MSDHRQSYTQRAQAGSGSVVSAQPAPADPAPPANLTTLAREQLAAIVENTSDIIAVVDERARVKYISPTVLRILGYSGDAPPITGAFRLVHPDDQEAALLAFAEAVGTPGVHGPVLLRMAHADGSWLHCEFVANNLLDDPMVQGVILDIRDVSQRIATQQQFELLLESAPDAMVIVDPEGLITLVNRQTERLFGYERTELVGQPVEALIPDRFVAGHHIHRGRYLADPNFRPMGAGLALYGRRRDGTEFPVEISLSPLQTDGGMLVSAAIRDVTDRRAEQEQFQQLLESAPDAMVIVDADGHITLINRQTERLFGYEREELLGRPVESLIPERFVSAHRPHRQAYANDPRPRPMGAGFDLYGRRKDGTEFPVEISLSPLHAESGTIVSAAIRDVSERKALEEQLVHQALHDPLTNLPNRALLMDRIERALARSRRNQRTVAVLFLDLDRFKLINDSRGHVIGDGILRQVAERLSYVVRGSDTVARFGGDEFVVVTEVEERSEVALLGARLLTTFDDVMVLEGTEAFVTASLGISIARGGSTADSLVREADAAMYHAKGRGPGRVEFFDESIRVQAARRLETENDLHRALDRDEFCVRYQPIIAIDSGELVGAEALVRWQHPERGLLFPADFMPVAEETGLVDRIGLWVLGEALQQLAAWGVSDSLLMAVNLSAHQLRDPNLPEAVASELARAGVDPTSLVFEITESVLVDEGELVVNALHAIHDLKRLGVGLALDDFGTGYSSLGRLKRLPVDELKVDREFVQGLGTDRHDSAIVSATLAMAAELNLSVVAEGVETFEQLEHLRLLGCPLAQGFLFAEALPPEQFATLLAAHWDDGLRRDAG
jgi:diguanylate cyclase (GGDEF)-like protein/PAS domain S-box-containing protein